jgi:peptide/nickel transport system substrate-binding protein
MVTILKKPSLAASESSFVEGILSERPAVINPLYADLSDANRDISSLVFSGLTKYDPQLKAFVQDVAELTIMEDKKTYRFKLKDNIFWHDGEKLTIDDVYFTYHDLIQNSDFKNPVLKANFDGVKISKVDGQTIDFTIKTPNSFFITNFNVGILPLHILKNVSLENLPYDLFNVKPVGTGPYMVNEQMEYLSDGRQRLLLTRFDKYYGSQSKIKNLKILIYPDVQSLLKEINILDLIAKVPRDIIGDVKNDSRFLLKTFNLPQYTAVFLNNGSSVLKMYKVRLALQKSLDKTKLLELLDNKAPIDSLLLELNQADWVYKVNLDEAKGALFDSGFKASKDVNDPIRKDIKGKSLTLTLLARAYDKGTGLYLENEKVMNFLVESWKNVGIDIVVKLEDEAVFRDMLTKRDYDLVLIGQSLGYNSDTYAYWHSSQANESGLNLSNYKSFAADSLIENIRNTFDYSEREALLKSLGKVLSDDIPAIFLYRPTYIFAYEKKIKGFILENFAYISDRYSNISQWCTNC